jgi:hypothetical protein
MIEKVYQMSQKSLHYTKHPLDKKPTSTWWIVAKVLHDSSYWKVAPAQTHTDSEILFLDHTN